MWVYARLLTETDVRTNTWKKKNEDDIIITHDLDATTKLPLFVLYISRTKNEENEREKHKSWQKLYSKW